MNTFERHRSRSTEPRAPWLQGALWEKHPEVAEAVAFEPKEDGTCPGLFLGGCGQTSVGGFWVSMFGKTSSYTQSAIHK